MTDANGEMPPDEEAAMEEAARATFNRKRDQRIFELDWLARGRYSVKASDAQRERELLFIEELLVSAYERGSKGELPDRVRQWAQYDVSRIVSGDYFIELPDVREVEPEGQT